MNLRQNQKGFTIVELLIVVVVIAILAAISIVAYTGITNRANRSAAMEAANSVKSVASAFQGANDAWPTSKAQFVSGHNGNAANAIAKLPSDITFVASLTAGTAPTGGPKSVVVTPQGSPTTGFIISYYDYSNNTVGTMSVGTTGNPQTALGN